MSRGKPAVSHNLQALERFESKHGQRDYLWVSWLDFTSTIRTRIFPRASFVSLIQSSNHFTISNGTIGILANDALTPVCDTTGVISVEPDLSTLTPNYLSPPSSATVLANWRDASGNPHPSCPRSTCHALISRLASTHNLSPTLGFEIEVVFLRRSDTPNTFEHPIPFSTTHAWSSMSPQSLALSLPLLDAIVTALAAAEIPLQQFHAESGAGQFEFILPPRPALSAIDTLLHARQIIAAVAETHGLRATLHPRPLEGGAGTGSHVHASLTPTTGAAEPPHLREREMAFWTRGMLHHLTSICAFTLPLDESYERIVDDSWTGGSWIAWGTQNREVPLRAIPGDGANGANGRWEVRCVDGVANMYFAVAAIVAGGILGLERQGEDEVVARDCLRKLVSDLMHLPALIRHWCLLLHSCEANYQFGAALITLSLCTANCALLPKRDITLLSL